MKKAMLAVTMLVGVAATAAQAQVMVKHIQSNEKSPIATAVWAGDTLYLSGQLADPVTPADAAKGTPAVYGDTKTQAFLCTDQDPEAAEGAGSGYEGRCEDDGIPRGRSGKWGEAGLCGASSLVYAVLRNEGPAQ